MKKLTLTLILIMILATSLLSNVSVVRAADEVVPAPPTITGYGPIFPVAGGRFWIQGSNFLGGPSGTPCSEYRVYIYDPQTGGVNWLDACQERVTWEGVSISFIWPGNLKEFYLYEVKVFRVGTLSNMAGVKTGGSFYLPFLFR